MTRLICRSLLILFLIGMMEFIFHSTTGADERTIRHKRAKPGAGAMGSRTALVIGNGDYESSPLRNSVNDANAIAKALEAIGFEVVKKTNLRQIEMKKVIDNFGKTLNQESVALFYFAGHGIQVNGRNYLIPTTASIETEEDVEYEAVRADRVLAKMARAKSRINIVILDACRNNPFARSFRSGNEGLAHMDAPSGTLIAYATAPGSVASDGPGENGLYTQELIKNIITPGLTIEEVFKRVRAEVRKLSQNKQTPWESSSLIGNFYFTSRPESDQEEVVASITTPSKRPQVVDQRPLWGKVKVTCNVNGAKFNLAGHEFTTRAGIEVTIDNIPAGLHAITAHKEGYRVWQSTITVEDNGTARLDIKMTKMALSREEHNTQLESLTGTAIPADIAKAFLIAYKDKNLAKMARYCTRGNKKLINEIAGQGEQHPRYDSLFEGWRWRAVLSWDGQIGEVRYPSSSETWVAFNEMKKTGEIVVVTLVLENGGWYVEDIHSPTEEDFKKAKAEVAEELFLPHNPENGLSFQMHGVLVVI